MSSGWRPYLTDHSPLTKLDRKQYLNVLYPLCVFRADRKNKMAAPVFGRYVFDISSETTGRNSTRLDRKQDPHVQVRSCFSDQSVNKKWPPCPIHQKGARGTLHSGARYVAHLAPCYLRAVHAQ